MRAHHRRCGQRNHHGNQNRHRERYREFAEQPAYNATHEQDGNEDGDQREADCNDCVPNLRRAFQSRVQRAHSLFEVARDILNHYDCVVHYEAR